VQKQLYTGMSKEWCWQLRWPGMQKAIAMVPCDPTTAADAEVPPCEGWSYGVQLEVIPPSDARLE
jgi:hypothetical protein